MLLTEEEAKKRWCPFANVNIAYQKTGAGGNRFRRDSDESKRTRCIASECMAWRPEIARAQGTYVPREPLSWISAGATTAAEPKRPDWMTPDWRWDQYRGVWKIGGDESTRGYCGLASPPQS